MRLQTLTTHLLTSVIVLVLADSIAAQDPAEKILEPYEYSKEVTLTTRDSLTIYGDFYAPDDVVDPPIVLLFHQAGANARAEYGPLVSRVLGVGYHALAIDQRNGGSRLGGTNRTMQQFDSTKSYSYCEAYPDLEATLEYAHTRGYKTIVVWGSSYSAALVVRLAVEHPNEVDGVLGFSAATGPAMGECDPGAYLSRLKVPALFLRPPNEVDHPILAEQIKQIKQLGLGHYVAQNGVHGSSMLNRKRVSGNVEPTWERVIEFLEYARNP